MTEPKIPQELNEAVAEKLGERYDATPIPPDPVTKHVLLPAFSSDRLFQPATDPAAALWALERYCQENGFDLLLEREGGDWECQIWHMVKGGTKILKRGTGTFCEAICRAIVGAAE